MSYSGETKCPKCGNWQIPVGFCGNCGYDFSLNPVFSTNVESGRLDEKRYLVMEIGCIECGESSDVVLLTKDKKRAESIYNNLLNGKKTLRYALFEVNPERTNSEIKFPKELGNENH
jgi:hypothetical protein